jgi:hypothetical protein
LKGVQTRVLLSGLGDLGRRLAHGLAGLPEVGEIVLAGRPGVRTGGGPELAALTAACGAARVRFLELDAADRGAVETLLRRERPDLVVQCASLLSPWLLPGRTDPAALALGRAGFALQLPAQLPLVRTLLEAVHAIGLDAPVVNCSYPDLTHPVLARLGLAPTVGIGNATMIRARVLAALRSDGRTADPVRLLAHHAQVTSVVLSRPPEDPEDRPRVFLGEDGEREDGLAYAEPPIASERSLNALPAASGLPLLRALLPGGPAVRISAPGPQGLPGGWPLRVEDGRLDLDLPPGVTQKEALALQERWARLDGIERIDADGTVHFTAEARSAVAAVDPGLAEPLPPDDAWARLRRLRSILGLEPPAGAAA